MKNSLVFICLSIVLTGCSVQNTINSTSSDTELIEESGRKGDTTLSGTISKNGELFFLTGVDGTQQEIDSYSYELSEFEGKAVEITGQFSGDTLFVGSIQESAEAEE